MSEEKTYTAAGIATDDRGNTKLRFTSNLKGRLKAFKRAGWTDVVMMEVEEPLGKRALVELLAEHEDFQSEQAQELIDGFLNG